MLKLTVYTLATTNINYPAPNSVEMYVTIRSQMSFMDVVGPELSELFALEFAEIAESDFVYTLASLNIITNYGHNKYDSEILSDFDYGSNPTVASGVICP